MVPGFGFVCFVNGNRFQTKGKFFKICALGVRVKITKRSFEPFCVWIFCWVFWIIHRCE